MYGMTSWGQWLHGILFECEFHTQQVEKGGLAYGDVKVFWDRRLLLTIPTHRNFAGEVAVRIINAEISKRAKSVTFKEGK